jgi:hypothetical protein
MFDEVFLFPDFREQNHIVKDEDIHSPFPEEHHKKKVRGEGE